MAGDARWSLWLRGGHHFKVEATIFLAVILTFAAVLWGDSLREKHLTLTDPGHHFLPYFYSDGDEGGASSVRIDTGAPFTWTCELVAKAPYPYCGYGLQLDGSDQMGKSLDLSKYDHVDLELVYRGAPTRLKLAIKNYDPAYSTAITGPSTMPVVAEFEVRNGANKVRLTRDQLTIDQWWLDQQPPQNKGLAPDLRHVVALDIVSGSGAPLGQFTVTINSIAFSGIMLTSAQWYLLILGAWLVLTGAFLVYRFITVRRGYEARRLAQASESEELAQARAAAEAASEAKSRFLANMSHELRTPLNAILGYAQLLDREELTERQKTAIRTIDHSGRHLLTLITDILDLSKIEAGKLDILPAPFDLHACIAHAADMIRPRSDEKDLTFRVRLADDVPRHVVGDAKRVRQILLNLLGNAVKFTAAGEIALEVSIAAWRNGQVRLRIDVKDTGVGIRTDQIDEIFEPFQQAGTALDRSGGTGLGLGITRQLAEAMDGEVRVASEVGRGTCFTAEIECSLCSSARLGNGAESASFPPPLNVLIVDDDEATREFLCEALSGLGVTASTAEDGGSALAACMQRLPDLVLMDLKMPGMSGLATIGKMKLSAELRGVPVVAISAAARETVEAGALAAGAVRLVQKPIDLGELTNCLALANPQTAAVVENRALDSGFAVPPVQAMQRLLELARAGNMRAVRAEATLLAQGDPEVRPFAKRLSDLAAAYQSPAVLRLVEQNLDGRDAA